MTGLDPGARAGLEEALNALVPEASNYSSNVARSVTHYNRGGRTIRVRIQTATRIGHRQSQSKLALQAFLFRQYKDRIAQDKPIRAGTFMAELLAHCEKICFNPAG